MTMQADEIFNKLKTFIANELLDGTDGGLDQTTPLLEWGVLDSLSMVSMLAFIEESMGIHVPDKEVKPENFENLQAIIKLLMSLQTKDVAMTKPEVPVAQTGTMVQVLTSYGIVPMIEEFPDSEQHFLKISGKRPTWLLIPPLGNPSTSWGEFLRTLINDQEALALDLVGFGLSGTFREEPFTYLDQLEETLSLLERIKTQQEAEERRTKLVVGPRSWVLIGSSLGALVATELVRRRPDWFSALILLGFGQVTDVTKWWSEFTDISKNLDQYLKHTYYKAPELALPLKMLLSDAFKQPNYESFMDHHAMEAMKTAFDGITVPTLFINGEDDQLISKAEAEAAAARVPAARLEMLSRCGHFPQAERTHEVLLLINSFLKTIGTSR